VTKLVIASLFLAVMACGGDSEEAEEEPMQETMMEREGPEGCYIIARMMCDCALTEAQCTGADKTWTPGCMSCEM